MVVGLFVITAIPAVTGISLAYSAQKNQEQRLKDESRTQKFFIDIEYTGNEPGGKEIHKGRTVLKQHRVWVGPPAVTHSGQYGYVAAPFYIEYPDKERSPVQMGLASQVQDDPPLLNWIYVDRQTMELKFGNKTASIGHYIGSWDWTDDENFVMFEDVDVGLVEEFYAVFRVDQGQWQLYFDIDQDGLRNYIPLAWTRLPVRLSRTLLI